MAGNQQTEGVDAGMLFPEERVDNVHSLGSTHYREDHWGHLTREICSQKQTRPVTDGGIINNDRDFIDESQES